jgi:hypothetical protein
MNSAVSPQRLHANLMIVIDAVDSTALTGIIRARARHWPPDRAG